MARTKNGGNGHMDEAMAALVHAQANLVQTQALFLTQLAETNRHIAELERSNSERFRRIEILLLEHSRVLEALPEAVREKIGFRAPPAAQVGHLNRH